MVQTQNSFRNHLLLCTDNFCSLSCIVLKNLHISRTNYIFKISHQFIVTLTRNDTIEKIFYTFQFIKMDSRNWQSGSSKFTIELCGGRIASVTFLLLFYIVLWRTRANAVNLGTYLYVGRCPGHVRAETRFCKWKICDPISRGISCATQTRPLTEMIWVSMGMELSFPSMFDSIS